MYEERGYCLGHVRKYARDKGPQNADSFDHGYWFISEVRSLEIGEVKCTWRHGMLPHRRAVTQIVDTSTTEKCHAAERSICVCDVAHDNTALNTCRDKQ